MSDPELASTEVPSERKPQGAYVVLGLCGVSFMFFATMALMAVRHQAAAPPSIIIPTPTAGQMNSQPTAFATGTGTHRGTVTPTITLTATTVSGGGNDAPTATSMPTFQPTPRSTLAPTATSTNTPAPTPVVTPTHGAQ